MICANFILGGMLSTPHPSHALREIRCRTVFYLTLERYSLPFRCVSHRRKVFKPILFATAIKKQMRHFLSLLQALRILVYYCFDANRALTLHHAAAFSIPYSFTCLYRTRWGWGRAFASWRSSGTRRFFLKPTTTWHCGMAM